MVAPEFQPDPTRRPLLSTVAWPAVLTLLGIAAVVLVPLVAALALGA